MDAKRCPKCQTMKARDAFYSVKKNGKPSIDSYCIKCRNQYRGQMAKNKRARNGRKAGWMSLSNEQRETILAEHAAGKKMTVIARQVGINAERLYYYRRQGYIPKIN